MQITIKRCRAGSAMDMTVEGRDDQRIIFALCCILFIPAINNFLNSFLQIGLSIRWGFLTPVSYIFMALMGGLLLYPLIFRRKAFLGVFLFLLFGSALSYVIYPEIRSVIYGSPVDLVYAPVNKLIFFCIPALIGTACLTDYNALFEKMSRWGRCTTMLGIFTYVFVFFFRGRELQYMVYSYFMLLPLCCCFEHAKAGGSKINLIIGICGTVSIIMCGARGAVVSLFMYFALSFVMSGSRRIDLKRLLQIFLMMIAAVGILFFYEELLSAIAGMLDFVGINSRFITALSADALLKDSGRSTITAAIMEGIRYNPIGFGLYGDRYATGAFGIGGHRYAHNIFTEWLCDFGLIGGPIIIAFFFRRFFRMFRILRNRAEFHLWMAIIPYGVFQLLFSSSYLENIPFFLLVAMMFFANWKAIDGQTNM